VAAVRVWVDLTNSPHVLVFRPLIGLLRERGAEVEVTAREYAQTTQLLELHGIEAEPIGRHGGRSALGKARVELGRLGALRRWARGRRFDLALAHGSHDLTLTARSLAIPSVTTFDYEFAWLQHQLGCRAATCVVVPEAIPADRLARYGARPPKLRRYPGLKEEYYLADFEPNPAAAEQLGIDRSRRLVVVRTPPEVSLYHRHDNPLFPDVLERLGRDERVHAVVLPRTDEQRERIRALGLPSLLVPERAVEAQSLIAVAAAVVSAGGTMNREAVALGVPVYTTFGGRFGAVDEALIGDGRLARLADAAGLDLDALPPRRERVRRDPNDFLDLLLGEHG
jgi:predicted glycosyltransferase